MRVISGVQEKSFSCILAFIMAPKYINLVQNKIFGIKEELYT